MEKSLYSTNNHFEVSFGYHRAVRRGSFIFLSGTTALSPGSAYVLCPGDAAGQMTVAIEESLKAIRALGGRGAEDVVRVRMFLGKNEDCQEVGRAFKMVFGQDGYGVAATMLVVPGGFVNKNILVEIEMDAMVG